MKKVFFTMLIMALGSVVMAEPTQKIKSTACDRFSNGVAEIMVMDQDKHESYFATTALVAATFIDKTADVWNEATIIMKTGMAAHVTGLAASIGYAKKDSSFSPQPQSEFERIRSSFNSDCLTNFSNYEERFANTFKSLKQM